MVARRRLRREQVEEIAKWAFIKHPREISRLVGIPTATVQRVITLLGVLDLLHPIEKQTPPEDLALSVLGGEVDPVSIKKWRLSIGYTQHQLAKVAGVSITTITQIELRPDEFRKATATTREAIAETIKRLDPRSPSYKPLQRVGGSTVPLPRQDPRSRDDEPQS